MVVRIELPTGILCWKGWSLGCSGSPQRDWPENHWQIVVFGSVAQLNSQCFLACCSPFLLTTTSQAIFAGQVLASRSTGVWIAEQRLQRRRGGPRPLGAPHDEHLSSSRPFSFKNAERPWEPSSQMEKTLWSKGYRSSAVCFLIWNVLGISVLGW